MEVIACPICGKPLQIDTHKENYIIECPRCGKIRDEIPSNFDSQIITISEGKLCGPGLKNLEDKGQEYAIYEGKTSFGKLEEESVIEAAQEPGIKMDSKGKQTISKASEFKSNIPEGTAIEKFDFDFSSNKPRPSRTTTRPKKTSVPKTPNASLKKQERGIPSKFPRIGNIRKMPPWQHFALFYGTIGIALLTLVIFTIYKVTRPSKEVITSTQGAQKIWNEANNYYLEGELYYKEASYNRSNKQQYQEKLKLSQVCYQKALEMGKQSWQYHIQELIQKENMSPKEAEEYANINHGGYQQKIDKWQQEYKKIQEEILALGKEKH